MEVTLTLILLNPLGTIKMTFGKIQVCSMTNISNMFLAEYWRLRTSSRLFSDFMKMILILLKSPKILKYWVGVQLGQSYLMGRRCLFNLGWPPF